MFVNFFQILYFDFFHKRNPKNPLNSSGSLSIVRWPSSLSKFYNPPVSLSFSRCIDFSSSRCRSARPQGPRLRRLLAIWVADTCELSQFFRSWQTLPPFPSSSLSHTLRFLRFVLSPLVKFAIVSFIHVRGEAFRFFYNVV